MKTLEIGGHKIEAGARKQIELPVVDMYTHAPLTMPIEVVRGKKPGPTLFVSAAIHGDEINGVEVVRRLLGSPLLNRLKGTLIAVPIVNVQGFMDCSRYLPDRRDLNRCFPGSESGSLAARLANIFCTEIVEKADFGIDLHTAAVHRTNLPQIRADLEDPQTLDMANAFGVPILINAPVRDGSLRGYATSNNIPTLLYEAGEALRFDEVAIRAGVRGITNVMRHLGMLAKTNRKRAFTAEVAKSTSWIRAERSGILRPTIALGASVTKGQELGNIVDPFGSVDLPIKSRYSGIVVGRAQLPLVYEGDAIFHIARFDSVADVEQSVDDFHDIVRATKQTEAPVV